MTEKPAYQAQAQRIKQLEKEALEYMLKEKDLMRLVGSDQGRTLTITACA
jgi:hypothetical protein